jgi:radical SAM family uncharacterized protein
MNERERKILETRVLPRVERPGRYTDGELNAVHKDHAACDVRMALAFPDVYEIGMSHLGFLIVYHTVNNLDWAVCERVFTPWPDMEAALRANNLPLYSLETRAALKDFDFIGFTLSFELCYTNILTMLDLGGVALRAADRGEGDPLVLGGGVCAFHPEPVAPFFDLFLLGEAEDALPELLKQYRKMRGEPRRDIIGELGRLPGVYAPSLYEPVYEDGVFRGVKPLGGNMPVVKQFVADLDHAPFPAAPVQPGIEAVHDRGKIEIMRGCTRGCRFCNAGMIYRPMRVRGTQRVVDIAKDIYDHTGCEEVSLLSFNATDYPHLEAVLEGLDPFASPRRLSVSLPSTRLDTFTSDVGRRIRCVRATGLTFAPEAGSQRLRDVVNKQLSDEEMLSSVEAAFLAGWKQLKLYFMFGLPTETDEDVDAIAGLVERMLGIAHRCGKRGRGDNFHVSVSNFVPKPHTPFQWCGMEDETTLVSRIHRLRNRLKTKKIKLSTHDTRPSIVEAAFARGDRRLADVIEDAWRNGARFDAWTEHFKIDLWRETFMRHGLDADAIARHTFDPGDALPWDHLSCGVTKKHLMIEYRKALLGQTTEWCDSGLNCHGCGLECKRMLKT